MRGFINLTLITGESSSHIGLLRCKYLGSTTCTTNHKYVRSAREKFPLVNGERFIAFVMPESRLGLHKLNITLLPHTLDCDGGINKDMPDKTVLHSYNDDTVLNKETLQVLR